MTCFRRSRDHRTPYICPLHSSHPSLSSFLLQLVLLSRWLIVKYTFDSFSSDLSFTVQRKRRREKIPPEKLDDNREAKFKKGEEKVMSQAEKDDSSYKTSDGE
jgi:hypothetical protein